MYCISVHGGGGMWGVISTPLLGCHAPSLLRMSYEMYCIISCLISVHGGGGIRGVIATPFLGCHAPSLLLRMSYEMYCTIHVWFQYTVAEECGELLPRHGHAPLGVPRPLIITEDELWNVLYDFTSDFSTRWRRNVRSYRHAPLGVPRPLIITEDELWNVLNYFTSDFSARWRRNVGSYSHVPSWDATPPNYYWGWVMKCTVWFHIWFQCTVAEECGVSLVRPLLGCHAP